MCIRDSRQVMYHQQQALACRAHVHQQGTQQRAVLQIQAPLCGVAQFKQFIGIGGLALPQYLGAAPLFCLRLLLVVHHLAVDGVSWRLLLEDLQAAYAQARRAEPLRLPAKTSAYQAWAARLQRHAQNLSLIHI